MVSLSTAGILLTVLLVNYGQDIAASPVGNSTTAAGLCTGLGHFCDPMNSDCCRGLYCHRERPGVAGECRQVLQEVAPVQSPKATGYCTGFDLSCTGEDGDQGDCCPGLHCHKSNPDSPEGRCYRD